MEINQFKLQVSELIENIGKDLEAEMLRLFKSGAVDVADYPNDARLPKIIFQAAIDSIRGGYQWPEWDRAAKEEYLNLKCF